MPISSTSFSPLAFVPLMLAAWYILYDARRPLSLMAILMRFDTELDWLAIQLPTRPALDKALNALAALGLVERSGMQYACAGLNLLEKGAPRKDARRNAARAGKLSRPSNQGRHVRRQAERATQETWLSPTARDLLACDICGEFECTCGSDLFCPDVEPEDNPAAHLENS